MRTGFFLILLILIAMTFGAIWTIPLRDTGGRRTLVWVTDANPARKSQIKLFEQFAPALTAMVDSGNLDTSKVIVQSSGGHGPDMVDCYSPSQTATYDRTGIAWDITDKAAALGIEPSICWPGARGMMISNGRQFTFPTNCGPMALFYNKDVFDELGMDYPSDDWTWDEFIELAQKLTQKRSTGRGFKRFALNNYNWFEAVWQAGGSVYNNNGTRCLLDSPQAKEGWRFWYDLRNKWQIVPDSLQMSGMTAVSASYGGGQAGLFLAGRFALYNNGRWAQITWRQANKERAKVGVKPFRYGVVALPHKAQRACRFVARATAINVHSERRDDALTFLQFLASEPYCRDINLTADGISAVMKYSQNIDQITNPKYPEERECDQAWLAMMPHGRMLEISPFIIPEIADKIITELQSAILLGQIESEAAAEMMAKKINDKIQKNIRQFKHLREQYEQLTGEKVK